MRPQTHQGMPQTPDRPLCRGLPGSSLKFISTTIDGGSWKKRARHACNTCRKHKKRCLHDCHEVTGDQLLPSGASHSTPSDSTVVAEPITSSLRGRSAKKRRSNRSRTASDSPIDSTDGGVDLAQQDTVLTPPHASPSEDHELLSTRLQTDQEPKFISHLNPEGFFLASTSLGASDAAKHGDTLGLWISQEARNSLDNDYPRPEPVGNLRSVYPNRSSTEVLPVPTCFKALRAIYLRDIYPIFPILPLEILPDQLPPTCSPAEAVLVQALCIALATNESASPHLCLQHVKGVLDPRAFVSHLSRAISETIDRFKIRDHLLLARVFSILSLFSSFSTDDHTAAEYGARAISNIHTMQIQLDTSNIRKDNAIVTQSFLCVWALDRLNSVFHYRPSLMHTRDIGRDITASIAEQKGCFRALLMICDRLDNIVNLYRPAHQLSKHDGALDIPSFDELIVEANAVQSPTHLLATIETLYHSIAMLSHRFHSLDDPDRSSISYLRSSLSASRLIGLFENKLPHALSNFLFVPYSLSLALRVYYRELRLSKTPLYRAKARSDVLLICSLLEEFGKNFTFAQSLSRLATKIIREMDKVATSVLHARQKLPDQPTESVTLADDQEDTRGNLTTHVLDGNLITPNYAAISHAPGNELEAPDMPEYDDARYNAETFAGVYNLPDLPDIFEHFDPEFNLEAIDLALGQNLGLESFENTGVHAESI